MSRFSRQNMFQNILQYAEFLSNHVEFFPAKPVKNRRFLEPVKQEQQQQKVRS